MSKNISIVNKIIQLIAVTTIVGFISILIYSLSNSLNNISSSSNQHILFSIDGYLVDESNNLTAKQVLNQVGFNKTKENTVPYQLAEHSYWLKVTVRNNQSNKQLVLYADNNFLSEFELWNEERHYNLINNQNTLLTLYPHFNFELEENGELNFLVKTRTQGQPNIPLMVLTQDKFQQRVLFTQIIYGSFIGITLLIVIYNLVLFFALKDPVHLFYIGYLLNAFVVISSLTGLGHLIFTPSIMTLLNKYLLFINYYLMIFLISFTLLFLRYDKQGTKTYKLGQVLVIALFACSFYSINLDYTAQANLFFSLQPAVYIFALFTLFRKLKQNFSWAKYYVFSWFPLLIGSEIQSLVLLNYLEYSFITQKALLFSVMLAVILMAFALAERMRRYEQGRLTEIAYHITTGLPKKSNIERIINQLPISNDSSYALLIIKPQQIDNVLLYLDDKKNAELFKQFYNKLAKLFYFNDSIVNLTEKKEKISFVNNNSFAVLVDLMKQPQEIETLVNSIQQVISENYHIDSLTLPLTATVGIAKFPQHGANSYQLLNHAIRACEKASLNANKWQWFENETSDQSSYYLKLTSDLKKALDSDQLSIFHQPQIDLRTLRVCSSECLIRWHHPIEGLIQPSRFIPVAEDIGIMTELTLWVIKRSLSQQKQINEKYGFNHMVSINISGKDIAADHFFANALDIIESSEVPTNKIIFELTESVLLDRNQHAIYLIEQLKELGITISIDDYGTGYSSMSQISELPFQELKVDRQFVENIDKDKKRSIIAKSTIEMAKGLGLEVVAEGINSQQDEDTMRNFGCDIGQGYFYAKPMEFNRYIQWLLQLENGRIKPPLTGEYIPNSKYLYSK